MASEPCVPPGRNALSDERERVAKSIDPETAEVFFLYAQVLDPYGEAENLLPEERNLGRVFFAQNPREQIAVCFRDLPPETRERLESKRRAADVEGWRLLFEKLGEA